MGRRSSVSVCLSSAIHWLRRGRAYGNVMLSLPFLVFCYVAQYGDCYRERVASFKQYVAIVNLNGLYGQPLRLRRPAPLFRPQMASATLAQETSGGKSLRWPPQLLPKKPPPSASPYANYHPQR